MRRLETVCWMLTVELSALRSPRPVFERLLQKLILAQTSATLCDAPYLERYTLRNFSPLKHMNAVASPRISGAPP